MIQIIILEFQFIFCHYFETTVVCYTNAPKECRISLLKTCYCGTQSEIVFSLALPMKIAVSLLPLQERRDKYTQSDSKHGQLHILTYPIGRG